MPAELTPEVMVSRVGSIGSPPGIHERLNREIKRPNCSTKEIGELISADAVLTARLLRQVNSSYYAINKEVETVSKAVLLLGTEELQDLVRGTTAVSVFPKIPEDLIDMEQFWRHSLACAIVAQELAKAARYPDIERFYVAGLIHDIGKLVCYLARPGRSEKALKRCRDDGELHHRAEHDVFGFTHAQVGDALAKSWNLPRVYQQIIAFHHGPWRPLPELAVVQVADVIVNAMQIGHSGERMVPPLLMEGWKMLNLSENVVPPIVGIAERRTTDIIKNLTS